MNQIVTAIYADGVLRPLVPLELPEQTEVELEVRPAATPENSALAERIRVHQILVAAGIVVNHETWRALPEDPVSEEEQQELDRAFAGGKPLSEIIIEEREEGW
ncbi:MAG: antitoxin family protein [Blastocatellia bacterium]